MALIPMAPTVLKMEMIKSIAWKVAKPLKRLDQFVKLLNVLETNVNKERPARLAEFGVCVDYTWKRRASRIP
jgi:hypothetical protein